MHEAQEGRVGIRRDEMGRHHVRHWFFADLRALVIAFTVSVAVVMLAALLLEWAVTT